MSLSKVYQAITVINYHMKDRMRRVKKLEQQSDLTEKQKIIIGQEYSLFRAVETLVQQFQNTIDANLGKLPPQVVDLEQAVLGAIMLHIYGIDEVKSFLLPEHFYQENHKEIYKACLQLSKAGKPIDMRTVVFQLRQNKTIEIIGGTYYIAELTSMVSSAASIDYHARVIVEQAMKRQLILTCGSICVDGYDAFKDPFELLEFADNEIKNIRSWIKQ